MAGDRLKAILSTGRQAHYRLAANSLLRRGCEVALYTSTPASRLRGFDPGLRHRFVPAPAAMVNGLTRLPMPLAVEELDSVLFDRLAAAQMESCDLFLGASTSSLASGRAAKRLGAAFVLDRACPDIRVQQRVVIEEARKVGAKYRPNSPWFVERQVAEYEEANLILSPSDYSRRSFPEHLREKIVLAPLFSGAGMAPRREKPLGETFVVGVVGGQVLRKGYLYLLQAWKELALPNAELRIRSSHDFRPYPALVKLLSELPNVTRVGYVPDMAEFYSGCDAFILPSVDDGFGMALFEAVGSGVPSIATRNTGASELLVPDQEMVLIDAFSVQQIKDALELLYESPETRERLSANGAAAVARLGGGGVARCYEDGISRLLGRLRGRDEVGRASAA